ncbi:MAG: hypothetical protein J3R72DRAFT_446122 [Linnemannia gamsii]|nr:MAG: hypothetical protein J3R72DRAFT_446122 [Linnemannia gamsii]
MKFTTALLSVLAASASVVLAQTTDPEELTRLYYTEPTTATVWTAGKNATISWNNVCDAQNTGDIDISLYVGVGTPGPKDKVIVLDSIGKLNCLKSKTVTVLLPANLTTSARYALHVETKPRQSYSADFTIKGIDPPVTATPAPATVAPPTATGSAGAGAGAGASTTTGGSAGTPTPNANAAGSLKTLGASAAVLAATIGAFF